MSEPRNYKWESWASMRERCRAASVIPRRGFIGADGRDYIPDTAVAASAFLDAEDRILNATAAAFGLSREETEQCAATGNIHWRKSDTETIEARYGETVRALELFTTETAT